MTEPKLIWKVDKNAELAEGLASTNSMALVIATLYSGLRESGMTDEQAMTVTLEWVRVTFGKKDA